MAMDFCSRHSFDKEPQAPRQSSVSDANNNNGERKRPFMSEQEQIQAAMEASLKADAIASSIAENGNDDVEYEMEADDDDDEIECLGTEEEMKQVIEPSFIEQLLEMTVPDEPSGDGARVQIRMPDGKRLVRKFDKTDKVQLIYAYVAVSCRIPKSAYLIYDFPYVTSTNYLFASKTLKKSKTEKSFYWWQAFLPRICRQDLTIL